MIRKVETRTVKLGGKKMTGRKEKRGQTRHTHWRCESCSTVTCGITSTHRGGGSGLPGGGSPPPRRGAAQPGGTPGPFFPFPPSLHSALRTLQRSPGTSGGKKSHRTRFFLGGKLKCFNFCLFCSFKYIKKRTKATGQQRLSPCPHPETQRAGGGGTRGAARGGERGRGRSRRGVPGPVPALTWRYRPPAPASGNPPRREPERTQRGLFK